MPKKRKLTESEWVAVFAARCMSKRGLPLTGEQRDLVDAAYAEDKTRYADMDVDVFNATVPFGSRVRRTKEKKHG